VLIHARPPQSAFYLVAEIVMTPGHYLESGAGSFNVTNVRLEFPRIVDGDDVRVSATTYVTFKKCPESANVRLQGRYGPDSRAAFLGSLAHRIFSRHLTAGPIASDDFVQACREEIGGSNLNHRLAALEMRPSALAGAIEELRVLYERFTRLPSDGFEGSEVSLNSVPAQGVELVGTIDAIYREDLGGHRLVDWKTGELGDPEDQLLFYSLLWTMDRGDLPAYIEAVSVRTGERYRTVPTSDEMNRVLSEVAELINEIRAGWKQGSELEKRGGPWCRYCPILDECEEGQTAEALLN
jgi:hypothetical protein